MTRLENNVQHLYLENRKKDDEQIEQICLNKLNLLEYYFNNK